MRHSADCTPRTARQKFAISSMYLPNKSAFYPTKSAALLAAEDAFSKLTVPHEDAVSVTSPVVTVVRRKLRSPSDEPAIGTSSGAAIADEVEFSASSHKAPRIFLLKSSADTAAPESLLPGRPERVRRRVRRRGQAPAPVTYIRPVHDVQRGEELADRHADAPTEDVVGRRPPRLEAVMRAHAGVDRVIGEVSAAMAFTPVDPSFADRWKQLSEETDRLARRLDALLATG